MVRKRNRPRAVASADVSNVYANDETVETAFFMLKTRITITRALGSNESEFGISIETITEQFIMFCVNDGRIPRALPNWPAQPF